MNINENDFIISSIFHLNNRNITSEHYFYSNELFTIFVKILSFIGVLPTIFQRRRHFGRYKKN